MRTIAIVSLLLLGACGGEDPQTLNNAQQVYRAHANNLEQAAEAREGEDPRLERAAEIAERRAEILEEKPGEIEARPVIVDTEQGSVKGTDWEFEDSGAAD